MSAQEKCTPIKFCLGTAQFGLNYGVVNADGLLPEEAVCDILEKAADLGVACVDTARAYGVAEERLGRIFKEKTETLGHMTVITKLAPFPWLTDLMDDKNIVKAAVDSSIFQSCRELKVSKLEIVVLHRASQLDTAVWDRLLELRTEGVVGKLGISAQNVEEAIKGLMNQDVKHLQIPLNLLDWRWRTPEFLEAVSKRRDVTIHCRSCVLQGLLVNGAEKWPVIPGVNPTEMVNLLETLAQKTGQGSRLKMCFAFVLSLPFVDAVVGGVDNIGQLVENVSLLEDCNMTEKQRTLIETSFGESNVPVQLLDPAQWPRK